ncbi:MAG: hypothetical protein ACPGVG_07570, partial [Mycobacterium sp.]
LLDAAVQIARLADVTDTRLLVPAGLDSICATGDLTDNSGSVTVRRRDNSGDDLVLDISVTVPDGSAHVSLGGLR